MRSYRFSKHIKGVAPRILAWGMFVLLSTNVSQGQTQLFEDYDFTGGGFTVMGIFSESDKSTLADSLGEFYVDEISLLNELKSEWVFTRPGKKYSCGYHYRIAVCKDGEVLEWIHLNLNCNLIVSSKGYFYFTNDKIRRFYGRLKKPHKFTRTFDSIALARNGRVQVIENQGLIAIPKPRWLEYEGEFDFEFDCDEDSKDCFEKEDSIKDVIKHTIKETYPDEPFTLRDRSSSWTQIGQTVICNKSLSDKFILFDRDTSDYFEKWRPYELELTSYWKDRQSLQQALHDLKKLEGSKELTKPTQPKKQGTAVIWLAMGLLALSFGLLERVRGGTYA